jgi:hypothetical protein
MSLDPEEEAKNSNIITRTSCDPPNFTLIVGPTATRIHVHRVVLYQYCKYYRTLIDDTEYSLFEHTMEHFLVPIVQAGLDLLYGDSQLEWNVWPDNGGLLLQLLGYWNCFIHLEYMDYIFDIIINNCIDFAAKHETYVPWPESTLLLTEVLMMCKDIHTYNTTSGLVVRTVKALRSLTSFMDRYVKQVLVTTMTMTWQYLPVIELWFEVVHMIDGGSVFYQVMSTSINRKLRFNEIQAGNYPWQQVSLVYLCYAVIRDALNAPHRRTLQTIFESHHIDWSLVQPLDERIVAHLHSESRGTCYALYQSCMTYMQNTSDYA